MAKIDVYGLNQEQVNQLKQMACAEFGEANISQMAKKILLEKLNQPVEVVTDISAKHDKNRLEIRVLEQELDLLKQIAGNENTSPNKYVTLLIRKHLYQHTPLTASVSESLVQSNYQLLRIGRNLNQIARQLNAGEEASLSTVKISQLHQFIEKHTSTVHDVLRTNKRRFE